jgi:ribosome maturation factor RimP
LDLGKIEEVIRPLIEKSGFKLYDVEFQGRTLRISIEKPGGVSLEDCVETSRMLNPLLDVEDFVPGSYDLEVSSPGLDRSLRKPEHFTAVLNEHIHVSTNEPMSNWNHGGFFERRKRIKGQLVAFDGVTLKLTSEGHDVTIPLNAITKAYVDFELKTTPKKGKKG